MKLLHNFSDMTQKGASRLKTLKAKIKKTIVDSFTPEDIKYENKHYKYIKFNDKDEEDKIPQVEAVGSYNRKKLLFGMKNNCCGFEVRSV